MYLLNNVYFRSLGSVDRRNTLLSLAKSKPVPTDPYCYFTDQRIVANGFAMREYKGKIDVWWYSYILSALCSGDDDDRDLTM